MSRRKFIDYDVYYYPAEVDLDEYLIERDFMPDNRKTKSERQKMNFAKLFDLILRAEYSFKSKDPSNLVSMFPVCASLLQKSIRHYRSYLNFLCEQDVLFCNSSYSSGSCAEYDFEIKRQGALKRYVHYNSNPKSIFTTIKDTKLDKSVYPDLMSDHFNLNVDYLAAATTLNKVYGNNIIAKHIQELKLHEIDTGTFSTWKKGLTGRLYSGVSNLKKELRSSLLLNGESLIELDIKSSIPILLINVLGCYNKDLVCKIIEGYESKDVKLGMGRKEKELIMLCKNGLKGELDFIKYRSLLLDTDKDFYTYIAKEWNNKGLKNKYCNDFDRKTAKNKILSLFNQPKDFLHKNKYWGVFNRLFPNVAKRIEMINGDFAIKKEKNSLDNVKCAVAYITQGMESEIILTEICGQLKRDIPNITLFTNHDAIYTTRQYRKIIEAKIYSVYQSVLGIKPIVNCEDLAQKYLSRSAA